jgi:ammonia channel protein AmtB
MRVIIHGISGISGLLETGVFEWSVGIPNDGNPGTIHGIYRSSPTEHGSHGRLKCPYLLVKFVGCLLLGYELMNSH